MDEAIATARSSLDSALEELEAMEVIVDGRIGIVTDTKFAEASEVESAVVTEPITEAREVLSGVEGDADGERVERIEALLDLASYTSAKYGEYLALVQTFSYLDIVLQAFAARQAGEALTMAQNSRTNLEAASERHRAATEALASVTDPVTPAVPAFDAAAERDEQAYVSTLLSRWEPGTAGVEAYVRGLVRTRNAFTALEETSYSRAKTAATQARSDFIGGSERLETAIERDVEVFASPVIGFECQSEGFIAVADTLVKASHAGRAGETARADGLVAEADARVDAAVEDCSVGNSG
ncbi:hypothetical protein [Natronomonas amylolytica]|uniref:hypothetical protein n=1 Tax=Natronomonas amylolytica TaxID=3108498 RepID=UPI00300A561A